MEQDTPFDPQALSELTSDLQQLKTELILDSGGVEHLTEIEKVLIDSIDNVLEEVEEYKHLDQSGANPDLLRRKQIKIEALVLFVNEALDFADHEQEDVEFNEGE